MYALIQNGVVIELFTPPAGTTLAQCFPASMVSQFVAVPSGVNPQQGWTYSNGTFTAPAPVTPSASQQALQAYSAFLANGLNITFTDNPALTGIYAIDQVSQGNIIAEQVYYNQYSTFTNGTTTELIWPLANNTITTFTSIADFQYFAKGVAQQVAAAKLALAQNQVAMPTSYITVGPEIGEAAPTSPPPQAAGTATG